MSKLGDLRTWIGQMDDLGEIRRIDGAGHEDEIGGIVDIFQREMGRPAVLFDRIPGFAPGRRVLANSCTSVRRIAVTLGMSPDSTELDIVRFWLHYLRNQHLLPPQTVDRGSIQENVLMDGSVDLLTFPTPKWHEFDGRRAIGTGCMVVMRDPETGWVNFGCYRVELVDKDAVSVCISRGKHGDIIRARYHARGEKCPVAVVVGMHPLLYMVSGIEVPWGVSEYDVVGGILRDPVPVIEGPRTGLPIPADGDIAFEGTISPGDAVDETPFGEWTGYYAASAGRSVRKLPIVRVTSLLHRDNPIILGAVPAVPPHDDSYYRGFFRSAAVWDQLERAGVPGVKGVWAHPAGGSRLWLTVSIETMYPGHAKQAGLIASQCHAGAYTNKLTVVVDHDVDPTNMNEVVWALSTRMDPREDLEVIRGCWTSPSDPVSYPEDRRIMNARVVVDACRSWLRRETYPRVARSTPETDEKILKKWPNLLQG